MNDKALRQRLREGALSLTREWFSWEKTICHYLTAMGAEASDVGTKLSDISAYEVTIGGVTK